MTRNWHIPTIEEVERLQDEVDRLSAWLEKIDGGDLDVLTKKAPGGGGLRGMMPQYPPGASVSPVRESRPDRR